MRDFSPPRYAKAALKCVQPRRVVCFDVRSRETKKKLPLSSLYHPSLSLSLSTVRVVKRVQGSRRAGIRHCAPSKTPLQVCCQTRTCSEKARIYVDRYSLSFSLSFSFSLFFAIFFFLVPTSCSFFLSAFASRRGYCMLRARAISRRGAWHP